MKKITQYRLLALIMGILLTILIGLKITTQNTQNRFLKITTVALVACAWMLAFNKSSKRD